MARQLESDNQPCNSAKAEADLIPLIYQAQKGCSERLCCANSDEGLGLPVDWYARIAL